MSSRHPNAMRKLKQVFSEQLTASSAVCQQHGTDESFHQTYAPDGVLFAKTSHDVVKAVNICREYQTPITAFGAGTSLEGQICAIQGGLCIDLSQMNAIRAVHAEDLQCVIEPGVRRLQLNDDLRATGLFFPIDPGADATLGGMVSTRASGTNAVRYGTMRDNVLSLQVVLANGEVINTAQRAKKSAAGYDLTSLMIGAEGTLGIITEITLKLYGIPEKIAAAVCTFDTVEDAVNCTIETIQCGIPVARMELMDQQSIEAVKAYSQVNLVASPTLFMEFHGSLEAVNSQSESVAEIAAALGGSDFLWTTNTEQRSRLWQARHDAAYACKALRPGCEIMATDVCVPISNLAQCIVQTQDDIHQSNLTAPILGHVGDGNFHLVLLVDPDDGDELNRAHALHRRMIERAQAMDGTCTGEHGIGLGKIDYLENELGAATGVMAAIKQALDPENLMNPGKIIRL